MSDNDSSESPSVGHPQPGLTGHEMTSVSVVLPFAIDLPARYAVPVRVIRWFDASSSFGEGREQDQGLSKGDVAQVDYIPADGCYHVLPSGDVTLIAHLPDGRSLQVSTHLWPGTSVRTTLQGDPTPREPLPTGTTLLEHQRTALRFYVQSSLDSAKRSRRASITSVLMESADEMRLEMTKHPAGVQFLQLTALKAFPMNIATGSGTVVKLVRVDRRLAADLVVFDERVELALEYLQKGRLEDAAMTLRLQNVTLEDAEAQDDVTTAVVLLYVLLGTTDESEQIGAIERTALRMATSHPDVADFLVIAAECAAQQSRESDSLAQLAKLQQAGLPILNRSFVRATRRLAYHSGNEFSVARSESDVATLITVYRRMRELAPYVDRASRLLVITGRAPDHPGKVPLWRRMAAPFRRLSEQAIVTK
jgi:hypothetical protein